MENTPYQITITHALTKLDWGIASWNPPRISNATHYELQIVRNEVAGFQIHIRAGHEYTLVVDQANWLHPLGFKPRLRLEVKFARLAADAVEVFPVGWLEGDDRRMWMEYLDRAGYAEVPAGRPQAVYVRIRVPADLPVGMLEGSIRAFRQVGFADEELVWEGSLSLDVAPVVLPDVREYSFHLNLWQHLTALARQHRVGLWSQDHFEIIDRYYASLAQLGQKAVSIVVTEIPWSGQRCYRDPGYPSYLFEHALIPVRRTDAGEIELDFTVVDRVLEMAARYGIDREINLIGLINIWVDEEYGFGKVAEDAPDAVRVRCYEEKTGRFTYLRKAADLRVFMGKLQDYFAQKGLLDRVRVTADEPGDLEAFKKSLEFIREAAPGFQYGAAINHFEFLEEAPPQVLDFTPILPLACQDPQLTRQLIEALHQRGGRMFWYVCCWPPIPNTFLHSPLPEARLHGWLNFSLGMDGFLRWAFCLWPADPWERASWRAPAWNAGDMFFVLPGKDGRPVETLRYEGLRMAAQDYELLRMAEKSLTGEEFEKVSQQAMGKILKVDSLQRFSDVNHARAEDYYSLVPDDYDTARKILVDAMTGILPE